MDYVDPLDPILVIIGPSAAGKTSIAERLSNKGLIAVTPSWTTRQPRDGERSDFEHVFCDEATFNLQLAAGMFVETAQPFNDASRYGLPRVRRPENRQVPAILLRTMVLHKLFKHYPQSIIYQIESPKGEVERRLAQRAKLGADNTNRLALYDQEIAAGRQVAKRCFVNTDLDELESAVASAIAEDFGINPARTAELNSQLH